MKVLTVLRNLAKTPILLLGIMTVVGVAIFAANELYQKQVIQPWNSLAVKHTSEQAEVLANRLSAHFISLEKQLKEASLSPSLFQAL